METTSVKASNIFNRLENTVILYNKTWQDAIAERYVAIIFIITDNPTVSVAIQSLVALQLAWQYNH